MENRNQRESAELALGEYQPDGTIGADTYRSGFVKVTSSATVTTKAMTVRELVLQVIAVSSYPLAVTLPPVAEARGKIYSIYSPTHGESSCDITIDDKGDDAKQAQYTITGADGFALYFSNGIRWFCLISAAT